MKVYESGPGMYHYKILPNFAAFIFEHHVNAFAQEQYHLSVKLDLPLLRLLKQYSYDELMAIAIPGVNEYLQYLSENKGKELIELSLTRWVTNQLEIIGKFEVVAEDITLINHVRSLAFRKFIPLYTKEVTVAVELCNEIDSFLTASTTSSVDTYIDILKERISVKEHELLEAQAIAHVGSFEWNIKNRNSSNYTPELFKILEIDSFTKFDMFEERVHPDDRTKVKKDVENAFVTGSYNSEYRYMAAGGEKYLWARGVVINENGVATWLKGTLQDITSIKKVQQDLMVKTRQLEQSNESLQQFASIASHDLNEPLRKITTYTDFIATIEKDNLSERSKGFLNKVQDSSRRMRQMIDDLLSFSSLNKPNEFEESNLQVILDEAIESLEQQVKEKNVIIRSDKLPHAKVISFQVRQLFQNLLSNAIKFSKKDEVPVIEVTHRYGNDGHPCIIPTDKYLHISFKDNGIGFGQEHAEQIFQLFNRLHGRSQYEGTGIGLAVSKKAVENHGGIITATSQEGNGSTFNIIIPQ